MDGIITEDLSLLYLGIPRAWQSIVTGWPEVNANFKLGGEKKTKEKRSRQTAIPATGSIEGKTEGIKRRNCPNCEGWS